MYKRELFINPITKEAFLRTFTFDSTFGEKNEAKRNEFIAKGWIPVCTVSGRDVSIGDSEYTITNSTKI